MVWLPIKKGTTHMKLIDADKLYDWLYGNGYHEICEEIRLREGAGSFSPTPPVQPDMKRGDKVRHTDLKKRGPGIVTLVMGQKAQVYFEKTEIGQPVQAYYRLDKLEVITDDPST
jgi:hypothetical protein